MVNPVDCDTFPQGSQLGSGTHCNICLTSGQVVGLNYGGLSGLASLIAITTLFIIIAVRLGSSRLSFELIRKSLTATISQEYDGSHAGSMASTEEQLGWVPLMSIGGIMDFQWVAGGQVYCGTHCTVQGAFQFVGETAVAMFTLIIALHTFTSIWLGRRLSYRPMFWITYSVCVWVYVLSFALIAWAMHNDETPERGFFAPTPFWCWINAYYAKQRFGEYLWLWIAGVGNLVIYSVLALLFCGCFVEEEQGDLQERRELRYEGWLQLLNPLGYTILVLPISIVRWMYISSPNPPSLLDPNMNSLAAATLTFHSTFRLSGLINVLLVLFTRSGLLLVNSTGELYHGDPRRDREEHRRRERQQEGGQGNQNAYCLAQTRMG